MRAAVERICHAGLFVLWAYGLGVVPLISLGVGKLHAA